MALLKVRFCDELQKDLLAGAKVVAHYGITRVKTILIRLPKGGFYRFHDGREFEYKVFEQSTACKMYHAASYNDTLAGAKKLAHEQHKEALNYTRIDKPVKQ